MQTDDFRALLLPEAPSSLPDLHQKILQLVKAIPMLSFSPKRDSVSDMAAQLLIPELYDISEAHLLAMLNVGNNFGPVALDCPRRFGLLDDVHVTLLAILHAASLRHHHYDRLLNSIVMMILNENKHLQLGLLYILCDGGNRRFMQTIITEANGVDLFPGFVAERAWFFYYIGDFTMCFLVMTHLKLDPPAMMYGFDLAVSDEVN